MDDVDGVGGHYFEGMSSDPWDTMYTSDSNGYAEVDFGMQDFTLAESYPVAYRAMVVHLSSSSSSTRAAAGLVSTASAVDDTPYSSTYTPTAAPTHEPTHLPTSSTHHSDEDDDKVPGGMIVGTCIAAVFVAAVSLVVGQHYWAKGKAPKGDDLQTSGAEMREKPAGLV